MNQSFIPSGVENPYISIAKGVEVETRNNNIGIYICSNECDYIYWSRVLTDSAFQFPVAHLLALKHKQEVFAPKPPRKSPRVSETRQSLESDSMLNSVASDDRN